MFIFSVFLMSWIKIEATKKRAASIETEGACAFSSSTSRCLKIIAPTTTKMAAAKFWQKIMKAIPTGI